jgi:hypothetical protein
MQFLQCLCIGNGSDTPKRNSLKRTSSGKQAQNPEGNMIKNKILILGPGDSGKSTMFSKYNTDTLTLTREYSHSPATWFPEHG